MRAAETSSRIPPMPGGVGVFNGNLHFELNRQIGEAAMVKRK